MYNNAKIEYMMYPRALALAEIAWSPMNRKNFEDFSRHLEQVWIDNKLVVNNEGDVKASTMNDSSVALAKGLHPIKVVFLANIIGGWPSWWSSTAIEMRKDNEKEFTAVSGSQLFK